MNSINSKAWIHSIYQTQPQTQPVGEYESYSNVCGVGLTYHSVIQINSLTIWYFSFANGFVFNESLQKLSGCQFQGIHFPWQRTQTRLSSWNLLWFGSWQQWCLFCWNKKNAKSKMAMHLYLMFQPITMLAHPMQTQLPNKIVSTL